MEVTRVVTMDPFNPGAFAAILLRDGRRVATARNAGRGRGNHYVWLAHTRRTRRHDRDALGRAARDALPSATPQEQADDRYVALLIGRPARHT